MNLIKNEPVLTAASVTAAIIAILSIFGVVLNTDTLETIVAALLPIALAAIARWQVTPTAKLEAGEGNNTTAINSPRKKT